MIGWLLAFEFIHGGAEYRGKDIKITEEAVSVVSAGDWIQNSKRYQNPLKIITRESNYNIYLVH